MLFRSTRDKIFSPSGRGRTFFLTSLFIELIDPGRGGFECNRLVSSIIKIGPVLLQLAVTSKVLNNAGSQRTCALV